MCCYDGCSRKGSFLNKDAKPVLERPKEALGGSAPVLEDYSRGRRSIRKTVNTKIGARVLAYVKFQFGKYVKSRFVQKTEKRKRKMSMDCNGFLRQEILPHVGAE